ncbi:phage tail protein [Acinetobacter sp. WCHAc060042]|uniref:phage tail-collar fiber domain-containing protein n=1 Tax=Acinetobacter sp. WCHAc060042 TaxID=2213016 RepID=UPI001D1729DA|nr:phage tail protein [Acinetobacter sp. WCHAc060042]
MSDYFNVTTNVGDAAIATAIVNNTKLNITHIAFGDGNGSVPTPTKTRSTLVKEVHRQAVTKYTKHPTIANYIVIETIIPSNIGGFWIREMGIIADNVLISHGSHAPFFKVADPDGVSEYRLKFTQNVRDGNVVEIFLDESLIYASQAWVNENYIRRNELVDNLTTNDSTKPVSARQAKILQESKVQLDNSPTSQGAFVSWNKSEGQGETDFINHRGLGAGGFRFYNGDNDKFNLIAYIDGSGTFTPLNGMSGNASTATQLKTARKINNIEFDGSKDITIKDDTKLPLSGGEITGDLAIGGTITVSNVGDQTGAFKKLIQAYTTTDGGYLAVGNTGQDRGFVEIGTTDDNDAEIYATQRDASSNIIRRAILLDGVGNTSFPEHVYAKTFNGGLNGNSSTTSKLQTARDVSFSGAATGSFNFDGSANASCILTLANSGVVASTYGSTLKIPVLTVNAKGLITGVSEQNIPMVDDLTTDDGTKPLSARQGKKLQDEKFPLTGGTLNGSMRAITLCANGQADYTPSQQGAYLSWNRTSGLGKTDFINHKGGGGGGFDWWNGNQDSYTSLMNLDPNGVLYSLGGFAGNANTATKLKTPRTIFGQTFDGSDHVSGTVTASTGLVQSDEYHYIDMGRNGLDRMNFYSYGATYNFVDTQNGNIVARLTSTGIDCNSATTTKLKTSRNIALSGAVSGNADFDGSGNITINTQLKENTAVARAYVNFSVSGGVVSIHKSMNIVSVVRNSSGVFTLTFANALDDAEYVWAGSAYHPSTTKIPVAVNGSSDLVKSTTQLQVLTTYASSSTGTIDAGQVSVVVF